jgi:hypothetical protein
MTIDNHTSTIVKSTLSNKKPSNIEQNSKSKPNVNPNQKQNLNPNAKPKKNVNPNQRQNLNPNSKPNVNPNQNKEQNFNRAEPKKKHHYKDPLKVLKTLSDKVLKEENNFLLVNCDGSAPHLVFDDPRKDDSKVSVVFFSGDGHFRVYDNYEAKIGDKQEVFFFSTFRDISEYILSSMEDESSCYDSYFKEKTA